MGNYSSMDVRNSEQIKIDNDTAKAGAMAKLNVWNKKTLEKEAQTLLKIYVAIFTVLFVFYVTYISITFLSPYHNDINEKDKNFWTWDITTLIGLIGILGLFYGVFVFWSLYADIPEYDTVFPLDVPNSRGIVYTLFYYVASFALIALFAISMVVAGKADSFYEANYTGETLKSKKEMVKNFRIMSSILLAILLGKKILRWLTLPKKEAFEDYYQSNRFPIDDNPEHDIDCTDEIAYEADRLIGEIEKKSGGRSSTSSTVKSYTEAQQDAISNNMPDHDHIRSNGHVYSYKNGQVHHVDKKGNHNVFNYDKKKMKNINLHARAQLAEKHLSYREIEMKKRGKEEGIKQGKILSEMKRKLEKDRKEKEKKKGAATNIQRMVRGRRSRKKQKDAKDLVRLRKKEEEERKKAAAAKKNTGGIFSSFTRRDK